MSGAGEELIFEDGKVSVSRTTLRVKRKTYSIAGIGSVEVKRGAILLPLMLSIVFGIMAIATWEPVSEARPWYANVSMILAVVFGISIFGQPHKLMIRTASGELQAMDGKKADVQRVKEAVEKAFAMRG